MWHDKRRKDHWNSHKLSFGSWDHEYILNEFFDGNNQTDNPANILFLIEKLEHILRFKLSYAINWVKMNGLL